MNIPKRSFMMPEPNLSLLEFAQPVYNQKLEEYEVSNILLSFYNLFSLASSWSKLRLGFKISKLVLISANHLWYQNQ